MACHYRLHSYRWRFDGFVDVPGVDEPDERYQKGSEEKHDSFFFDNSIFIFEDIDVESSLDQESHDSSCKEESQRIFEHEAKLIILGCKKIWDDPHMYICYVPPPGKFIYKFAINPATNKNKHHSNAMPCSIPTLTTPKQLKVKQSMHKCPGAS